MSDKIDPSKPLGTNPDDVTTRVAAQAGMPTGAADRGLHGGTADRLAGAPLDPHARAADHTLRPDMQGRHDPLAAARDPHDRSGDHTLRPDPLGRHDPLPGAAAANRNASMGGSNGGSSNDIADSVRDKAAGVADALRARGERTAEDARSRFSEVYDDARSRASALHRDNMRRMDDLTVRGVDGLNRGRTAVESFVNDNPVLVGVVGVAAGLLLGALLPRTREEDRRLGPLADEVRGQGLRYAREFTNRGREFVQTALDPENIDAAARKAAEPSATEAPAQPGNPGTPHHS